MKNSLSNLIKYSLVGISCLVAITPKAEASNIGLSNFCNSLDGVSNFSDATTGL